MEQSVLTRILDVLEEEEQKLLIWGDTGGAFAHDELTAHIRATAPGYDPKEILNEMLDQVMLFRFKTSSDNTYQYRTRMAESVHLFRNLRQWFPGKPLEDSKSLVSDYRFIRRPRSYPIRNQTKESLYSYLQEHGLDSTRYKQTLDTLIGNYKLSGFQVRATQRILSAFESHTLHRKAPSATIVCAGTGSGKTLAFYLPGFASIIDSIKTNPEHRVRVLAIYPRNELLKDQFIEAWSQVNKISTEKVGISRPIQIAAFYGETPRSAFYLKNENRHLNYRHWLKCLTENCNGVMRWLKNDIESGRERLVCSVCGAETKPENLALTRESMSAQLPDIVFTTTEMLNTNMGNPKWKKLLGVDPTNPPNLVLLDEVHTYEGNHGAQVSMLLRRWMRISSAKPHFVGLSATLSDAESFFERLTSTNRSRVMLIEAANNEIEEEGAEYLLALRGDPVSQTALLSTTIQSAMLMHRILDLTGDEISRGVWGTKTFLFTDTLDITNRLYWQLADAEGWQVTRGQLELNNHGPLASLRNPLTSYSRDELQRWGQDWSIANRIGYSLDHNDRAIVDRTSSQDKGVNKEADLIVATASLEVGYNDPSVGAVIQHKGPRNVASYLQRKGRAGRPRGMRPWTLVVLSDFGRDRVIYQHYEKLVSPEIKNQRLPISNTHILRMQAAMAVLDWLSVKTNKYVLRILNTPYNSQNRNELINLKEIVEACILSTGLQDELLAYIKESLNINEEELNRIAWQSPRSIMLEYLPTLRRRLETNWSAWNKETNSIQEWLEANKTWRSPVPEFIPDNLFSDLNLPTLNISLNRLNKVEFEQMDFFQGLQEFAPGRISKRFSVYSSVRADWLVPPEFDPTVLEDGDEVDFEISDAFTNSVTELGTVSDLEDQKTFVFLQPHYVQSSPFIKDFNLTETSNSQLQWRTQFNLPIRVQNSEIPLASKISEKLKRVTFFLHKNQTQLEMYRFNTGARANLRFRTAERSQKVIKFKWTKNKKPACVGTRLWVDALKIDFTVDQSSITNAVSDKEISQKFRTTYFQDGIRGLKQFEDDHFSADWIFECTLACISLETAIKDLTTEEAINKVFNNDSTIKLSQIPRFLFSHRVNEEDIDSPFVEGLQSILEDSQLLKELKRVTERLYKPICSLDDSIDWVRNVLGKTMSASLNDAITSLMPDIDERAIIADYVIEDSVLSVYLSELESGGAGIISQFQEKYAEDPVSVLNLITQSLKMTDYEQLDSDLIRILSRLNSNSNLKTSFDSVREAKTFSERVQANEKLKLALRSEGIQVSHSFSAVLFSRILRSGSTDKSDKVITDALSLWSEIESQLGYELPMNIYTTVATVMKLGPMEDSERIFKQSSYLQGILWPRGAIVRQNTLHIQNRFDMSNYRTERILAEEIFVKDSNLIEAYEPDWIEKVNAELINNGQVDVKVNVEMINQLSKILVTMQTSPIESMGLWFFARCSGIRRVHDGVIIKTEFAEALN